MKKNIKFLVLLLSVFVFSCGGEKETQVLFEDDFSDASTIKKNWEIFDAKDNVSGPSQWEINDKGQLQQNSNIYRSGNEYDFFEGTMIVTKKGENWTDYSFVSEFGIVGDNDGVGMVFRYQDPEHFYRFITVEDPANQGPFRKLQVKDGDKYVTLDENNEGYDAATTHNVKITVKGNKIKVFFDGKETLSAEDDHYKNGKIGLMCYAEQPVFDNVVVSKIE